MLKVFISYSRQQREKAFSFKNFLKSKDHEPLLDDDIILGDNWKEKVAEFIENCEIVFLLWSIQARDSDNVDYEIETALDREKRIIPILLDDTKLKQEDIEHNNWVEYFKSETDAMIKLSNDLNELDKSTKKNKNKIGSPITSEFKEISGGKFFFSKLNKTVEVKNFELTEFLITNLQFRQFDENHHHGRYSEGDDLPVNEVSWIEATMYCKWLSEQTNQRIRLPTEKEWEYAAKAGQELEYATETGEITSGYANFGGKENSTTPMGKHPPSDPFKIYDMSGNLWEWCDDLDEDYSNFNRVIRGGSFIDQPLFCCNNFRYFLNPLLKNPFTGFRVVRVLE